MFSLSVSSSFHASKENASSFFCASYTDLKESASKRGRVLLRRDVVDAPVPRPAPPLVLRPAPLLQLLHLGSLLRITAFPLAVADDALLLADAPSPQARRPPLLRLCLHAPPHRRGRGRGC